MTDRHEHQGGGFNDAPALVTVDVVLVQSDPRDMPRIGHLSKARYRKMSQNFWWAGGYTILAIPLAAGVLYSWGILLDLAVGAIPLSLSAVIASLNAPLLRRVPL